MDRRHYGLAQAYHLMQWLSEVHPEIFKEWVAVQDVMNKVKEPTEMIVDEMESED